MTAAHVPRRYGRHQQCEKAYSRQPGVRHFFRDAATQGIPLFLSAVTIGELRQGVEAVRHRGDLAQATRLSRWLGVVTKDHADAILPFDEEVAQIWGRLRVPHAENPLDKQIAATALIYDLTWSPVTCPTTSLPA